MNERVGSSERSRCSRSGTRSASLIDFALSLAGGIEGRLLRDPAEHVLMAVFAGGREVLRVDARVALREAASDRFELPAPAPDELVPTAIPLRRLALVLVDSADPLDQVRHA